MNTTIIFFRGSTYYHCFILSFIILLYKCAFWLKFIVCNPPKPHAFCNVPLQSTPAVIWQNRQRFPENEKFEKYDDLRESCRYYFTDLKKILNKFRDQQTYHFRDLPLSAKQEIFEFLRFNHLQVNFDLDVHNSTYDTFLSELVAMRSKVLEAAIYYNRYNVVDIILKETPWKISKGFFKLSKDASNKAQYLNDDILFRDTLKKYLAAEPIGKPIGEPVETDVDAPLYGYGRMVSLSPPSGIWDVIRNSPSYIKSFGSVHKTDVSSSTPSTQQIGIGPEVRRKSLSSIPDSPTFREMKMISEKFKNNLNENWLIFVPFCEIYFVRVIVRTAISGVICFIWPLYLQYILPLVPYIMPYVEFFFQIYRIYKLPSRIKKLIEILTKVYIYVKNNPIAFSLIFICISFFILGIYFSIN